MSINFNIKKETNDNLTPSLINQQQNLTEAQGVIQKAGDQLENSKRKLSEEFLNPKQKMQRLEGPSSSSTSTLTNNFAVQNLRLIAPPTPQKMMRVPPTPQKMMRVPPTPQKNMRVPPTPQKNMRAFQGIRPIRGALLFGDNETTAMQKMTDLPIAPRPSISPFLELHQNVELTQTISVKGNTAEISPLGFGTFMNAFEIRSKAQCVENVSNEELVVKVFNREWSSKSAAKLTKFMQNSLDNYKAAMKLKIPVATIYNEETAINDHYYLQRFIPGALDVNDEAQMEQVFLMYKAALESQTIFDLSVQNLRVANDGTVTLIDFVENAEDGFKIYLKNAIKSFAKAYRVANQFDNEATIKFFNDFTKRLEPYGYKQKWNESILDEIIVNVQVTLMKGKEKQE